MTLQACLIASSSSFYGMITSEFNEARRGIVLYNAQGQKIRRIPLYQDDPVADNHLQRCGKAPIIILLGTSTSGKTNTIQKILPPDLKKKLGFFLKIEGTKIAPSLTLKFLN